MEKTCKNCVFITGLKVKHHETRRLIGEGNIKVDLRWCRVRGYGLYSNGWEQNPVVNSYEHGNEPSSSIKGEEFLSNW